MAKLILGQDQGAPGMYQVTTIPSEGESRKIAHELLTAQAYTNTKSTAGLFHIVAMYNGEIYQTTDPISISSTYSTGSYSSGSTQGVHIVEPSLSKYSYCKLNLTNKNFYSPSVYSSKNYSIYEFTGAGSTFVGKTNNKLFNSTTDADKETSGKYLTISNNFCGNASAFTANGKLYKCYSGFTVLDSSGVWTNIICNSASTFICGTRNGVVVAWYNNGTIVELPVSSSMNFLYYKDLYNFIGFYEGNNVYFYKINKTNNTYYTENYTLESNVVTVINTGTYDAILIDNDKMYPIFPSQEKNFIYSTPQSSQIDSSQYTLIDSKRKIFKKDNALYYFYNNNFKKIFESESSYTLYPKQTLNNVYQNFKSDNSYYLIKMGNDAVNYKTLYVPTTKGSYAYGSLNVASNTKNITSSTTDSIIVGGEVYYRDFSRDSTFEFLPNELKNHNFTDQEMCQAIIRSGLNI